MLKTNSLTEASLRLIKQKSPAGAAFWLEGRTGETVPLQDHADIVYSLYLLGEFERIHPAGARSYLDWLARVPLHGRPAGDVTMDIPNAHLTAYLLGAVRLLENAGQYRVSDALYSGWSLPKLIDERQLPIWPKAWTHHIWRVSHWIGGIPSILLHLARSGRDAGVSEALVLDVLAACDTHIVNSRTGLLKPYRSEFIQQLFRLAYRLRHDPDMGDVGGVVHLLWVNHAVDRPYVAPENLHKQAVSLLRKTPFLEAMPYCLDFDIVQLARTTQPNDATGRADLTGRAEQMERDIVDFLTGNVPVEYTLHKLPGALATMHECAFIADHTEVTALGAVPLDVIKEAFWI